MTVITKTTVKSEIKYKVKYICEKCGFENIFTQKLPYIREYQSHEDKWKSEAEAKQQHYKNTEEYADKLLSKFDNGNYRAVADKPCRKCKYLQSWQIKQALWSAKYKGPLFGFFIGGIIFLVTMFCGDGNLLTVGNCISVGITIILITFFSILGRKEAARIKNNFDPALTKLTPIIERIEDSILDNFNKFYKEINKRR